MESNVGYVPLVLRARRGFVAKRRLFSLAANNPLHVHVFHQPFHRTTGHAEAFAQQLPPDLARAVNAKLLFMKPPDMG